MIKLDSLDINSLENDEIVEIKKVNNKDIAIIGISTYLPMANHLDEFWENLKEGKDCIKTFPINRKKDMDKYIEFLGLGEDAKKYNIAGHLDEIDKFDYRFFKISPKEASLIDPNQRLFLQNVWQTIQDGGYEGEKIRGTRTGIYLGYNADTIYDYKKMINQITPESGSMAVAGNLTSVIGGRLSYLLDLRGPSITVDTACSSSLTAVHLACRGIQNGDCEMAIVGSVKTNILPMEQKMKLGIESSDSRTRAFDDRSDGTVMGEGVASILLKPLSKAIEDKDNIYAVIKGSATNQDGNSIGLTAPNSVAQEDVIVKAWEDAGVEPESISYIEAHGTGTELGDPIEIDGIQRAFRRYTDKKQFCGIGSVKTNIGHLDNAAGMASIIKTVLALKNKEIPPSINFKVPNNKINFEDSPVYVNDKLQEWEKINSYPRRCGVSAFGLSGTNCHVILEEAPEDEKNEETMQKELEKETELRKDKNDKELKNHNEIRILTISAKSTNAFINLLNDYKNFLNEKTNISLDNLCYTSNTGREQHNIRLAVVAESVKELIDKILNINYKELKENKVEYEKQGVYFNNYKDLSKDELYFKNEQEKQEKEQEINNIIKFEENNSLKLINDICVLYVNGGNISWKELYKNASTRTISIPLYPFEETKCWLDIPEGISLNQSNIYNSTNIASIAKQEIALSGKKNSEYSKTEEEVAKVWGETLGFKEINIGDNFYELGGDSIIAMKIVNNLNKKLKTKLEIAKVLENQTISELASYIDREYSIEEENMDSNSIQPLDKKEYYEVSSAQKRMYILNQIEGISTSYNISGFLEIEGEIDYNKFQKSFKKLIDRHEALRTSFDIIEDRPVQIVKENVDFQIEKITLKANNENNIKEAIEDFIRPYDLNKSPLFRVGIIRAESQRNILIVDMHHIISDGSSVGIIIKELMEIYRGNELEELNIHYKEFCNWQNNILQSDEMKEQENYWLNQFKGDIPVLNLSTDYKRPSKQSFEGNEIKFEIDEMLSKKLKKLAKETGTTLYMVLLAAYNIFLSKNSGQEDIIVGSLISGRNNLDLENMIGMFVNTLALRSYPEGDKTFREFLNEVKNITLNAYDNQEYQFEEIINKLNLARDYSRNPLFDTLFVMQNMEIPEIEIENLKIKPYEFTSNRTRFDISLEAVERNNKINFIFEYCIKLFKKETIDSFIKNFINILNEITQNTEVEISQIDILDKEEKNRILIDFNDTYIEYTKEKTINQLFEEQVEKTPKGIALVYDNKEMTYEELNKKANSLAKVLVDLGTKTDDIVGIMVDRSFEMIIGILGVLKSGGAYLPIDPEYPQERIKYVLDDSGSRLLLTKNSLETEGKRLNLGENITLINLDEKGIFDRETENLSISKSSSDLAYVIYTSGSTGKPKGVMIEHRTVNNFIEGMVNKIDFEELNTILSLTTMSFDIFGFETLLPLVKGLKVVIAGDEETKDSKAISRLILENKVDLLQATPSRMKLILNDIKSAESIEKLKTIAIGGEPFPKDVLKALKELSKELKIYNMYGPTETTIWSTVKDLTNANEINIGTPIANTEILILDKYGCIQPIGVSGELCIGGEGLARGYLNRQDLTEEKFITNPYNTENKIYRTGDLAKWLSDGNIEFIGRIDNQVKIRGYRIELGEIEKQLLNHEYIKEAVVLDKENDNGIKYLCGYIISEKEINIGELREYLLEELPEYMIPSYFIKLEKMPLTPNGKIDRKALPEPEGKIETGAEYEAPRNETEKTLVEIWTDILDVEKIGINDNFFNLGGHSLKATTLISRIHKTLNVEVPLNLMFKNPNIKTISEYISNSDKSIYSSIKPVEGKEYYPLSSAQKRMYIISQMDKNSTNYNMPSALEIEGELDLDRVEKIFKELVDRHESLRTSFIVVDEEPVQKIHSDIELEIKYEERNELDLNREEVEKIIVEFIKPFDLRQAPLLRVKLIKLEENKYILMTDMHHIISDGISTAILLSEFLSLYSGREIPKLRIQYKDYSVWQRELLQSEEMDKQQEYWINKFSGELPKLKLPTDYERPEIQSFEGKEIDFFIEEELTEKLNKLSTKNEVTMYMTLMAAYNILLFKYSRQEDIIVGSPVAGRQHPDFENIIGMFVNTVAIRNNPQGERTIVEFLNEVKTNILEAFENQDYQFEDIVEKLNIARDASRNPIFDVIFTMQNMDLDYQSIEELTLSPYEVKVNIAKVDLSLFAREEKGKVYFNISYSNKLFNRDTIEKMVEDYKEILRIFGEEDNIKLKDIELEEDTEYISTDDYEIDETDFGF